MKSKQEQEHDNIVRGLATKLRESGEYRHVWEDLIYKRTYFGQIDLLAQRDDGRIEFYEIKLNPGRIGKAQNQYNRFKRIFSRRTIGFIASKKYLKRLK